MERSNLDFEIAITREQWDQLGRGAAVRDDGGVLEWSVREPEVIRVNIRDGDVPPGFHDVVSDDGTYGEDREHVAEFVYNGGRPFAAITPISHFQPPNVLPQQEQALQRGLQNWVRNKWHSLLDETAVELGGME